MGSRLTGRDPRSLGDRECSAFELGLSRAEARALRQVAFDELATASSVVLMLAAPPIEGSPQRCL
jgi:hypothetical protein